MNVRIAEKYRALIADLNFADLTAGLTKIMRVEVPLEAGTIIKTFPVVCNTTIDQCNKGDYIDLLPDSERKTIFFFEDLGVQFVEKQQREFIFHSRLRLIGWINLAYFKNSGCSISGTLAANIIKAIELPPDNISGNPAMTKMRIVGINEIQKTVEIFLKYTAMNEEKDQYLLYPFDFFALDITTQFSVPLNCINEPEMQEPEC